MVPSGSDIIFSWIYHGFATDLDGIWIWGRFEWIWADLFGFIFSLEHLYYMLFRFLACPNSNGLTLLNTLCAFLLLVHLACDVLCRSSGAVHKILAMFSNTLVLNKFYAFRQEKKVRGSEGKKKKQKEKKNTSILKPVWRHLSGSTGLMFLHKAGNCGLIVLISPSVLYKTTCAIVLARDPPSHHFGRVFGHLDSFGRGGPLKSVPSFTMQLFTF